MLKYTGFHVCFGTVFPRLTSITCVSDLQHDKRVYTYLFSLFLIFIALQDYNIEISLMLIQCNAH